MHPILADGGELTVMRDLAAFTYGTWDVEWPDSVPEENRPVIRDDRQHGYVYRMPKQVGRMGRRFVRADVTITAAEYTPQATPIAHSGASDVEHTLDEATKRTEGNVFLERAVTRAGLGMLVPYKDFDVDDVLPVDVWGKIIERPVTSIDVITERGAVIDWRVHFGDALVGDEASRGRANAEIFRTIAQERRERIREVGEVRQEAQAAQQELEVTIEEQGKALQSEIDETATGLEAVRSALHGEESGNPDLVSQLVAVNAQLQRLGAEQQPSLMLAFVELSTKLWEAQDAINETNRLFRAQQEALNQKFEEQDVEAAARHDQLVEQMRDLQEAMLQDKTEYELLGHAGSSGTYWQRTSSGLVALGSWTGEGVITAFERRMRGVLGKRRISVPQSNGSRVYDFAAFSLDAGGWAEVMFSLDASEQKQWSTGTGAGVIAAQSWATYDSLHVPVGGARAVISFSLTLQNAHRGARYEIRVVDGDGRQVGSSRGAQTLGPLTSLGSGRATLSHVVTVDSLAGGQTLSFQAWCSHPGEYQRQFASSRSSVSVIVENK